jgi:hypothetical protein
LAPQEALEIDDTDDEVERQMEEEKANQRNVTADNMTYDDFIDKYLDHIEGRVQKDSRPYTADTNMSKEEKPVTPPTKRGAKNVVLKEKEEPVENEKEEEEGE